jgi:hypothetical protein
LAILAGSAIVYVAIEYGPDAVGAVQSMFSNEAPKTVEGLLDETDITREGEDLQIGDRKGGGGKDRLKEDFDSLVEGDPGATIVPDTPEGTRRAQLSDGTWIQANDISRGSRQQGYDGPPTMYINPPEGPITKVRYW